MIALDDDQYAAIGRVTVESGTLEREIEEYLERLGEASARRNEGLTPKLRRLQECLRVQAIAKPALAEFEFAFSAVFKLINKRNDVVHGVWSSPSNAPIVIGSVSVTGRGAAIHAREIAGLASQLRTARKFFLRLWHDHLPVAAGHKNCPRSSARALKSRLARVV